MVKLLSIDPGKYKCGLVFAEISEQKVYKALVLKSEIFEDGDQLSDDLNVGLNVSYDYAFDTRLSGNFKYIFGGKGKKNNSKIIDAITASPSNRDVRVHDGWNFGCLAKGWFLFDYVKLHTCF